MEDYIYILLGIVWILYSAYRASKKKKARNPSPQKREFTAEKKNEVEDVFKKVLLGETEPYEPAYERDYFEEPEPAFENEKEPVVNKTKFKLDSVPKEEGVSIFEDSVEEKYDEITTGEDAQESENLRDYLNFDLKKAVIFSEILNRPYQ